MNLPSKLLPLILFPLFGAQADSGHRFFITDIAGEVTVQIKKGSPSKPLTLGSEVQPAQTIRLHPEAKVRLISEFGEIIDLEGGSTLQLNRENGVRAHLTSGSARFSIPHRKKGNPVEIHTRTLIVRATGADCVVRERVRGQSEVLVLQREVQVLSKKPKSSFKPIPLLERKSLIIESAPFAIAQKRISRDDLAEVRVLSRIPSSETTEGSHSRGKFISDLKKKAAIALRESGFVSKKDMQEAFEERYQERLDQLSPQGVQSSYLDLEGFEGREVFRRYEDTLDR